MYVTRALLFAITSFTTFPLPCPDLSVRKAQYVFREPALIHFVKIPHLTFHYVKQYSPPNNHHFTSSCEKFVLAGERSLTTGVPMLPAKQVGCVMSPKVPPGRPPTVYSARLLHVMYTESCVTVCSDLTLIQNDALRVKLLCVPVEDSTSVQLSECL